MRGSIRKLIYFQTRATKRVNGWRISINSHIYLVCWELILSICIYIYIYAYVCVCKKESDFFLGVRVKRNLSKNIQFVATRYPASRVWRTFRLSCIELSWRYRESTKEKFGLIRNRECTCKLCARNSHTEVISATIRIFKWIISLSSLVYSGSKTRYSYCHSRILNAILLYTLFFLFLIASRDSTWIHSSPCAISCGQNDDNAGDNIRSNAGAIRAENPSSCARAFHSRRRETSNYFQLLFLRYAKSGCVVSSRVTRRSF